MKIKLNGAPLEDYGLTPLYGTLDNVLMPAERKKLVTNANAAADGEIPVNAGTRKLAKRTFDMMFRIEADSPEKLVRTLRDIEASLVSGADGKGMNTLEFEELGMRMYVCYNKISKYENFGIGSGKASITINFTEPNPANVEL